MRGPQGPANGGGVLSLCGVPVPLELWSPLGRREGGRPDAEPVLALIMGFDAESIGPAIRERRHYR